MGKTIAFHSSSSLSLLDIRERFNGAKFSVSETIDEIQDPESLCAQQVESIPSEGFKYFPCTQGVKLSIDRSRLYMPGCYVQVTMYQSTYQFLHITELEVHGY